MTIPVTAVCDCGEVFRRDEYQTVGTFAAAISKHERMAEGTHDFNATLWVVTP